MNLYHYLLCLAQQHCYLFIQIQLLKASDIQINVVACLTDPIKMLFMLKHNSINAISKIAVKSLYFKTIFTLF